MPPVRPFTSRLSRIVLISGGFCVALGLMALAGWHTQNLTLIRAVPASAPMYYNTAVGFVLCGTGLLAVVCGWLALGRVGGALTTVLGLGTLSQYLSGVDLGIDQLAMRDLSGFANPYPGRMAPTTAVCFVLSGMALLLVNGQRWRETSGAPSGTSSDASQGNPLSSASKTALLELHGVILTVAGLMTCTLYLTGLMTAYGWGRVVNMAVPTAAGFAVLGVGFLSLAWREHRTTSVMATPWMPVLVGTAVVSATLLLCQALLVQEQAYIERATTAAAASVRSEITARMDMRILSLVRMAHHWEYAGAPPHAQWEAEATLNLRHFPGSHSIAWADPSGHVRWLVSRDATQTVETLTAALSQYGQGIIQSSRTQNTVTVLPASDLLPTGKGFMVLVPIPHKQEFAGFMVGLFAFQELLEASLKNIAPNYGVTLFDDETEVYRRNVAGGLDEDEAEWGQETIIDPYGVTWRARVWPLPEELAVEQSVLPTVTLGAGLILATLLAWVAALAQAARKRARETALAYTGLSAEMAERQRAEEALRVAHNELERRVQERTAELAQANNRLHQENLQRRRAEESLAHQAQELARSNGELEHFAHVASHDLQEPLRKIQAFGDRLMLKCREDLGEQGRDYLERMQSAATRMQTLISDLLTFSRVTIRPRPFVSVDLAAVAHAVVSDLEVSIQRVGATVQIEQLPTIDADPGQMGQVLQNLIGNALKFHRAGVPPVIKVWGTLLHNQSHGAGHNGSGPHPCRLYVEDNGIGFEEKHLDLIFQPFQRLFGRGEYEGTGMGLAICKKIVERHGGHLTAQSTPGQGTTFIVTLPTRHLDRGAEPWPHVGDQVSS